MQLLRRAGRWSYLVAVLGPVLIVACSKLIPEPAGSFLTSLSFIFSVLAAGVLGGWKPGLLTTVASVVVYDVVFVDIRDIGDLLRTFAYLVAGVAISLLCEGVHAAGRRVMERQRRLEAEIAERRKAEQAVHEQAEQLREADRRKDEFLAMLAHELRNPLAPLSNALQVWPLVENDRKETENLRVLMQRQLHQMTRLIDDLLDVSRITRGKIQLRPQHVDFCTIVSGAVESMRPFIDQFGHQVSLSLSGKPLYVNGDLARLSQIVGNILHNAAKYTPANGTIRISTEENGNNIVLRICDNGCGIPEQMLAQIFDMFHQVDQTLDRSQGGLGIGLTLVKRLVELHGGSIDARSDGPGKGSEFVVTLPSVPGGAADHFAKADATAARANELEELPRRKILVVDDVRASAETLSQLLRGIGQNVFVAFDGQQALNSVLEHRPSVVFLDIAMPGMNGYDVAKRIREVEGAEETVLIALTGYGQEEDRRRAAEAGFDFHLTKPATIEALHGVIAKFASANGDQSYGTRAERDLRYAT